MLIMAIMLLLSLFVWRKLLKNLDLSDTASQAVQVDASLIFQSIVASYTVILVCSGTFHFIVFFSNITERTCFLYHADFIALEKFKGSTEVSFFVCYS